jgi:hypothetical protein
VQLTFLFLSFLYSLSHFTLSKQQYENPRITRNSLPASNETSQKKEDHSREESRYTEGGGEECKAEYDYFLN